LAKGLVHGKGDLMGVGFFPFVTQKRPGSQVIAGALLQLDLGYDNQWNEKLR